MNEFEIYFADLTPGAQKSLLEAFGMLHPREANWDYFPLATLVIDDEVVADIDHIRKVASFIVGYGTANSTNGSWYVSADDISREFSFATQRWLQDHCTDIARDLDHRGETAGEAFLDFTADGTFAGIDCTFYGKFCKLYEDGDEESWC